MIFISLLLVDIALLHNLFNSLYLFQEALPKSSTIVATIDTIIIGPRGATLHNSAVRYPSTTLTLGLYYKTRHLFIRLYSAPKRTSSFRSILTSGLLPNRGSVHRTK